MKQSWNELHDGRVRTQPRVERVALGDRRRALGEPAAHGLFLIASLFENEKGDPAAAVERFKKVNVEPWLSQARQRVAVM